MRRRAWCWPSILTISSRTILMTCWVGESAVSTSWPMAFSLTASMNCLTTRKWTSASSSATRISRSAASIFAAEFSFSAQVLEDALEFVA